MTKQLKIYDDYVLFEARDFRTRLIFADSFTNADEARVYGNEKFEHCVWLVDKHDKESLDYEIEERDEEIILTKGRTRVIINKRDGVDFHLEYFSDKLSQTAYMKSKYSRQYKMLKSYKEKYEQTK